MRRLSGCDEFYEQVSRLGDRRWKGRKKDPPQIVAAYTSDIVYVGLTPNILKE
jgi:hypothetical protein